MAAKQEKASYDVKGLLEKGGPSTDVFKKTLGVEKTTELFEKVLLERKEIKMQSGTPGWKSGGVFV